MSNVARLAQEVNETNARLEGMAERGPYIPAPTEGLKEVFMAMWTRLNEVDFAVQMLALQEPGSEGFKQNLAAVQQAADVNRAYAHMSRLLNEATAKKAA